MINLKPGKLVGCVSIPSSKSQTIRALLIATFASGRSVIHNPLFSSDTEACFNAVKALGAEIEAKDDGYTVIVDPQNVDARGKSIDIDTMNSGTTTYLIYGLLGTLGCKEVRLSGDEQLNRRPILPLVNAYNDLGMEASATGECPPVVISGTLKGGKTSIECRTSQYLSSLLLSLPLAKEDSVVDCPLLYEKPYVRMTLSWLDAQGIKYKISDDLQHAEIKGGQKYKGFETTVTGDFSSASFFFAAAALSSSSVTVSGLDRGDVQGDKHVLDILEKMGCRISWDGYSVTVMGPEELKGGIFDLNSMPDALPILSVVALKAKGETRLVNAPQARIKETDRIASMREDINAVGGDAEELPDGLIIRGKGTVRGGKAKGFSDHRIIMAMAMCSAIAEEGIEIDDESACSVTFPTFLKLFDSLRKHP